MRELADGQAVEGVFAVRERELRQRRNGGDWLRLVVCDRSGNIEAVVWEAVQEAYEVAAPGAAVHVRGRFGVHPQYGPKITVEAMRRGAPQTSSRPATSPTGRASAVERLEAELRELLETIQNPQLRALLDAFFAADSPVWSRFREAPAAKYYHQAYRHGLLDHTVSVAQAVSAAASAFPGIDRDVAVTGALLHDIGKTMAYNDDPLAIDLTDAGRLQGEIPLGYYLVRREVERIQGFDPDLAQAIFHIVLSHHGTLENGSPVAARHPRGDPGPRDRQPGRQARQLRPDRARPARRRGLVALRPRHRLGRLLQLPRRLAGRQSALRSGPKSRNCGIFRNAAEAAATSPYSPSPWPRTPRS